MLIPGPDHTNAWITSSERLLLAACTTRGVRVSETSALHVRVPGLLSRGFPPGPSAIDDLD